MFVKQYAVVMETCNHHVIGIPSFISVCYHWKVWEVKKAKCMRLFVVTCIVVICKYIMYANFRSRSSYTDTCDAIIMYCMSLFVVNNVVYKQISMTSLFGWRICTFLQNFITQSLDDATIEEGDEHRSQISGAPMASMMCVDNPETSREIICVAPAEGEKPLTIMTLKRCLILISFPLLMVGLKI